MLQFKTEVRDFSPDDIFDCGQCFRWSRQPDGSYTGIAGGRVAVVTLTGIPSQNPSAADHPTSGILTVTQHCGPQGESEESMTRFWSEYLDLSRDYGTIKAFLRQHDPVMDRVIAAGEGIRILKQDLWETMVSFIISQNNNIPRIRGCIEALARQWGQPAGEWEGRTWYSVPEPEILASLQREDMDACGMGYRGPYLIETARQVLEQGGMDAVRRNLENTTEDTLLDALRNFAGVGPKVASCIALFGLGRMQAFPVDVWMRRIMRQLYGIDEKDTDKMQQKAEKNFAPWGGIAQQYLFCYARRNL